MQGKAIIFSAPSGAGKTTIIKKVLVDLKKLEFSISATTRKLRGAEVNGIDYYFLEIDAFKQMINNQDFIEWEEVYNDVYYGTPKNELTRIWAKGNQVLFDVDVKGGMNLKRILADNALSIFIQPPSIQELRNRLILRGTDTMESIEQRVLKASKEMLFACEFDEIVINDNLQEAIKEVESIIEQYLNK